MNLLETPSVNVPAEETLPNSVAMVLRMPLRDLQAGRWVSVDNGPDTGLWIVRAVNNDRDGEMVEIHMERSGSIPPEVT